MLKMIKIKKYTFINKNNHQNNQNNVNNYPENDTNIMEFHWIQMYQYFGSSKWMEKMYWNHENNGDHSRYDENAFLDEHYCL